MKISIIEKRCWKRVEEVSKDVKKRESDSRRHSRA